MVPEQLARPPHPDAIGLEGYIRELLSHGWIVEQREHSMSRSVSEWRQMAQQLLHVEIHAAAKPRQRASDEADS